MPRALSDYPVLDVLHSLYDDIDGMEISRRARELLPSDDRSFTYGEIVFEEFAKMLDVVKPKPSEVFYDLGAGTGKAVFCSALLYDWKKCCGIDLLPGLHDCSVTLLEKYKLLPAVIKHCPESVQSLQFIKANLMEVDFQDADVIFTHATCFSSIVWDALVAKFRTLKPGTRIISVTKRLEGPEFELIQDASQLFTWGTATVTIYRKIGAADGRLAAS